MIYEEDINRVDGFIFGDDQYTSDIILGMMDRDVTTELILGD